jgi:hypothetical protein
MFGHSAVLPTCQGAEILATAHKKGKPNFCAPEKFCVRNYFTLGSPEFFLSQGFIQVKFRDNYR